MTMTVDEGFAGQPTEHEIKQGIAGPVPIIEEAPDTAVSLAVGIDGDTKAVVRELTGEDEERLARVTREEEFFATVVALGTEQVAFEDLSELPLSGRLAITGQLLVGDRDRLFMEIVRVTFGNERVVGFQCALCEARNEVTLLIDTDFPQGEGDTATAHEYVTSKGQRIMYRLVTGADQDEVAQMSLAEANTHLLSKCITQVDGAMVMNPLEFAKQLGMRDRRALLAEMADKQPSINMLLETKCSACGEEVPLQVGWGTLFRP